MYPLDAPWDAPAGFRWLAPDRSGYGRSTRPARFSPLFHQYGRRRDALFSGRIRHCGLRAVGAQRRRCNCRAHRAHRPGALPRLILKRFTATAPRAASPRFLPGGGAAPQFLRRPPQRDPGRRPRRALLARTGARSRPRMAGNRRRARRSVWRTGCPSCRYRCWVLHGSDDPRTEPGELERRAASAARGPLPQSVAGRRPQPPQRGPIPRPSAAAPCLDFLQALRPAPALPSGPCFRVESSGFGRDVPCACKRFWWRAWRWPAPPPAALRRRRWRCAAPLPPLPPRPWPVNGKARPKTSEGREYDLQLDLSGEGDKVTGSLIANEGTVPIEDGRVEGDQFHLQAFHGRWRLHHEIDRRGGPHEGPLHRSGRSIGGNRGQPLTRAAAAASVSRVACAEACQV